SSSEVAEPELPAPEPVTPEPVKPEAVKPEPDTPESDTREPVTPEVSAPELAAPEPPAPEPVTPEPVTPEPPAPEPPAPEPPAPEPPAQPAAPEPAAPPTSGRRHTAWLAPGAFDEEPALRSGPLPITETGEGEAQYPIAPAFSEPEPAQPAAVPTWSFRAPSPTQQPAIAPSFVGDLTLDPLSLRPRATIRSGAFALTVDESRLALRHWWQRSEIAWSDVLGFEPRVEAGGSAPHGHLVAVTRSGVVELVATKRPMSELRYLHALLDAYRQRAQLMAR
ncbi:MAG TPA: hypothetical protein VE442_16650, partial [Jatrophihabitans sp.]|nr:hypothetical protein [Jatrophihabitans sp.]